MDSSFGDGARRANAEHGCSGRAGRHTRDRAEQDSGLDHLRWRYPPEPWARPSICSPARAASTANRRGLQARASGTDQRARPATCEPTVVHRDTRPAHLVIGQRCGKGASAAHERPAEACRDRRRRRSCPPMPRARAPSWPCRPRADPELPRDQRALTEGPGPFHGSTHAFETRWPRAATRARCPRCRGHCKAIRACDHHPRPAPTSPSGAGLIGGQARVP